MIERWLDIPFNFNVTIFSNNKRYTILLKNNYNIINYYSFFYVKKNNFLMHKNGQTIEILPKKKLNNKFMILKNLFENYYWSLDFSFFLKIKYRGKGFRVRKKKNLLKFYFYFSHMNLIKVHNCKIRRVGKYKYALLYFNKIRLHKTGLKIIRVRHISLFTQRGLRFSRQEVFKRKGKKGAYTKKSRM